MARTSSNLCWPTFTAMEMPGFACKSRSVDMHHLSSTLNYENAHNGFLSSCFLGIFYTRVNFCAFVWPTISTTDSRSILFKKKLPSSSDCFTCVATRTQLWSMVYASVGNHHRAFEHLFYASGEQVFSESRVCFWSRRATKIPVKSANVRALHSQ